MSLIEDAKKRIEQARTRVRGSTSGSLLGGQGILSGLGSGQGLLGGQGLLSGLGGGQGILGQGLLKGGKLGLLEGRKLKVLEGRNIPKLADVRARGVASVLEDTFPKIRELRQGVVPRGPFRRDITDRGSDMAVESKPSMPADHRDMSFEL